MDSQTLSQRLDHIIAELLAQAPSVTPKSVYVVITGNDIFSLPLTLRCLQALERAGYALRVSFSCSASHSALKSACVEALRAQGSRALFDQPIRDDEVLCLPALSVNSMSKIALGMRDNLACEAVFDALLASRKIVVTLHPQCLDRRLPASLLARLEGYAQQLERYGVTIVGKRRACVGQTVSCAPDPAGGVPAAGKKRLIALRDIQRLAVGECLTLPPDTLITPAARDEVRRRNLTVIYR